MIANIGSVLTVEIHGEPYRVQVISDGPPDQASSAWGVLYGGDGQQMVLVKRVSWGAMVTPKFYGWWADAAGRVEEFREPQ